MFQICNNPSLSWWIPTTWIRWPNSDFDCAPVWLPSYVANKWKLIRDLQIQTRLLSGVLLRLKLCIIRKCRWLLPTGRQALIRAPFFLLRLKMPTVSFSSVPLKPYSKVRSVRCFVTQLVQSITVTRLHAAHAISAQSSLQSDLSWEQSELLLHVCRGMLLTKCCFPFLKGFFSGQ